MYGCNCGEGEAQKAPPRLPLRISASIQFFAKNSPAISTKFRIEGIERVQNHFTRLSVGKRPDFLSHRRVLIEKRETGEPE